VSRASGAPAEVLNAAFKMDIGAKTIVPGADAFYVLSIERDIAPKADAAKMAALKKEMQAMQSRGISDDYMAFLSRKYPIKPNKKVFQKLFGEK
jgi:hypothetical protein